METRGRTLSDDILDYETSSRLDAFPMMPDGIYFGRLDDNDVGEPASNPPQGFSTPSRTDRTQIISASRSLIDPPETAPVFPYLDGTDSFHDDSPDIDNPFHDDFSGRELPKHLPPISFDGLFDPASVSAQPGKSPKRDTILLSPLPRYNHDSARSVFHPGTTEPIAPMAPDGLYAPPFPTRRVRSWWKFGKPHDDHSDNGTGNSTESGEGDIILHMGTAVVCENSDGGFDSSNREMTNRDCSIMRRWHYLLLLGVLLMLIGAIVGLVVHAQTTKKQSSSSSSTSGIQFSTPTRAPASSPTFRPTIPNALEANLISLIQLSSPTTSFKNENSPQSEALAWIMTDPISTEASFLDRVLQRFALATLWFSTNGFEWDNQIAWLENTNECEWGMGSYVINCDSSGHLVGLVLSGSGLSGSLPAEIGLLTKLESLDLSYNELTGTVPAELDRLTDLTFLMLQSNNLEGSISSTLACSQSSQTLFLIDCRLVECECCLGEDTAPCP